MVSVIAALGLSSVRVLALLMEFDSSASYYNHDAVMPMAFICGAVIALIISALFIVLLRGEFSRVDPTEESSSVIFVSALVSFIMVGATVFSFVLGTSPLSFAGIVTALLAIAAAAYFLLGIAMPLRSDTAIVILSVVELVWMCMTIFSIHTASGININNPNKTLLLVALSAAAFFFLVEGRFRVGSGKAKRAIYVFLGLASIILLGLYSLPNAVLILLGAYPDNYDICRELIVLAIFIYVLIRMCVVSGMVGDDYEDEDEDEDADMKQNVPAYKGAPRSGRR